MEDDLTFPQIIDGLPAPISTTTADGRVELSRENLVLREEVDRTSMFEEIVGASSALQPMLDRLAKVARTDSTVLITGETGTGKELVARDPSTVGAWRSVIRERELGIGGERDPIIGRQDEEAVFTIPREPVRRRVHGIETFDVLRGGEYFMPSLSALR